MKIKVGKLSIPQLNYAVAVCEGVGKAFLSMRKSYPSLTSGAANDWSIGGPIIEREEITIAKDKQKWLAMDKYNNIQWDKTYLGSAMRCYVSYKLGNEVEIPDELISSSD